MSTPVHSEPPLSRSDSRKKSKSWAQSLRMSQSQPHLPAPSTTQRTWSKQDQRELQRKIFLNTMRNVYPSSLQIKYEWISEEGQYAIRPLSVSALCPAVKDKLWVELTSQLHVIFVNHVHRRQRQTLITWLSLVVAALIYLGVGIGAQILTALAYQIVGPIVFGLAALFLPNLVYTYQSIRPLLREFDEWKQAMVMALDREGIEVIKVTTGEIVSDKSEYRWLGALYFGSTVWFRFEDAQVEIFWRSVKSGKRVRRYSLMITTTADPVVDQSTEDVREKAELGGDPQHENSYDTLAVDEDPL